MKLKTKIQAFTLSEMIVVLILTSIVVGIAFTVLTLVQKHMNLIQKNFDTTIQFQNLKQSLHLDFNRFSSIEYNFDENELIFSTDIERKTYRFEEHYIIKDIDTFKVEIELKSFYFNGDEIIKGETDAIKLISTKNHLYKPLFVFKINDSNTFMN